ncbi:ThuA domain-containing protein [Pedobacter sp. ASV12]|uniref:ThuA domain-containing protein n=1 Tax=Pedobacter sp. ASV12 TaxID=2795120 RepID=UPI0018ECB3E0|nr:ThuA domain-containing protein [Pedobacter sp. ASV12]
MKTRFILALSCLSIVLSFGFVPKRENLKKPAVLVFSLTKGYRHASIVDGIVAIKKLGEENNFDVDTTENVKAFNLENLRRYKTLVFLSPTGTNVFNDEQKKALKKYINKGGGFVGIHAATDFSFEWEWYGQMVGGFFESHPKVQQAKLLLVDPQNKVVEGLPEVWRHTDEWYNFKSFNNSVKVIVKVDEASYEGGTMKNDHPITWYHRFDGGRVFYTALGHTKESYKDPLFLKQVLAGIEWTMK